MKAITNFLHESAPTNPFDVVVKNKFYPSGLREIDIYKYYMKNQSNILKWIENRRVAFRIQVDRKSSIIRRKVKGSPIKLTAKNFPTLINGRTNIIYVENSTSTNYFVIDIDLGPNLNMKHAIATSKFLLQEFGGKYEILTSSPLGVHYIGYVNRRQNINRLREKIRILLESKIDTLNSLSNNIEYQVNIKGRKPNTINFDLSTMYERSLHIAKFSLTKEFLICNNPENGLKRIKRKKD